MGLALDFLFPAGGIVFLVGLVSLVWKNRQRRKFSAAVIQLDFAALPALAEAIEQNAGRVGAMPTRLLSVDDAVIHISGRIMEAWVKRQRFRLLPLWPTLIYKRLANVTVTEHHGTKSRTIVLVRDAPIDQPEEFAREVVKKILHGL